MLKFDITTDDIQSMRADLALSALENINKLRENTAELPYKTSTLTVIHTPLANFVLSQIMFILNTDTKGLVAELGNTSQVKEVFKTIQEQENEVGLVDSSILTSFLEFSETRINDLLEDLDKSSEEEPAEAITPQI